MSTKTAPAQVHIAKITHVYCLDRFVHVSYVLFQILCCLLVVHDTKSLLCFWISYMFMLIDISTKSCLVVLV